MLVTCHPRNLLAKISALSAVGILIILAYQLAGKSIPDEAITIEASSNKLTSRLKRIPAILHQTFTTELVPQEYGPLIANCLRLNPGWRYYLWRELDMYALVQDHFPQFVAKYRSLGTGLQRADMIRYMVLYHYGGIYIDMDVQCVRPFFPDLASAGPAFLDQERREQTRILYNREFTAMNSAMGAAPGHPFFLAVLSAVNSVTGHVNDAGWTTGPELLTGVYSGWLRTGNRTGEPVNLLEPEIFSPMMDTRWHNFPRLCRQANSGPPNQKWRLEACKTVLSDQWQPDTSAINRTIGRHLFLHLAYPWGPKSAGRFNIVKAHPRVQMYQQARMRNNDSSLASTNQN